MSRRCRTRNRNRNSNSNSSNLAENDIIAYLDKYFIDFEHNLKDNNFDKMNVSLVKHIIAAFSKIFQLWDENLILRRSIAKDYFENTYKSMSCTFNTQNGGSVRNDSSNDFTLECNHCGEAFPLRNNDCWYSYDLHTTSEDHKEFIKNLYVLDEECTKDSYLGENIFHCSFCDQNIFFDEVSSHLNSDEHKTNKMSSEKEPLFHSNHVARKIDSLSKSKNVYIKDEKSPITSSSTSPISDANGNKAVKTVSVQNPSSKNNHNYFSNRIRTYSNTVLCKDNDGPISQKNPLKCNLCDVKLNHPNAVLQHLESKQHLKMENLYDSFAGVLVQNDNKILCSLCDNYVCTKYSTFLQHCQTASHLAKTVCGAQVKTLKSNYSTPAVDTSCFVSEGSKFQCTLCGVTIYGEKNSILHVQGKIHLNMKIRFESYATFMTQNDGKLHCTVCDNYTCTKYLTFFQHCQSNSHVKSVEKYERKQSIGVELKPAGRSESTTNKSEMLGSISVFDSYCLDFKYNSLWCKICVVNVSEKINFVSHFKGKVHSRMVTYYESYGNFIIKNGGEMYCAICDNFKCVSYMAFFTHCKSFTHSEMAQRYLIQRSNVFIQREIAKEIQCPVDECDRTLSGVESLLLHLALTHIRVENVLQ